MLILAGDINEKNKQKLMVSFIAFDFIYDWGECVALSPFYKRRSKLEAFITSFNHRVHPSVISPLLIAASEKIAIKCMDEVEKKYSDEKNLQYFRHSVEKSMNKSQKHHCDGVILKSPHALYDFGGRRVSGGWIKLKHDFIQPKRKNEIFKKTGNNKDSGETLINIVFT